MATHRVDAFMFSFIFFVNMFIILTILYTWRCLIRSGSGSGFASWKGVKTHFSAARPSRRTLQADGGLESSIVCSIPVAHSWPKRILGSKLARFLGQTVSQPRLPLNVLGSVRRSGGNRTYRTWEIWIASGGAAAAADLLICWVQTFFSYLRTTKLHQTTNCYDTRITFYYNIKS